MQALAPASLSLRNNVVIRDFVIQAIVTLKNVQNCPNMRLPTFRSAQCKHGQRPYTNVWRSFCTNLWSCWKVVYSRCQQKTTSYIFSESLMKSTARSIYSNGTYFSLLLSTISSCALKCQDIQQHIWWYRVTKLSQNYFTNGKRKICVVTKSQEGKINHFYYSGIHRTIRCNDLSLPNKRSAASKVCLDTELQRCGLEKEDIRKKKVHGKYTFYAQE